ncbi:MAG: dihydroorotase family protein [Fusobacteria bacterium]|nr:dihydroorotase family protein [Fusobacteriota bacterium]
MGNSVLIKNVQIVEYENHFKRCDVRIINGRVQEMGNLSALIGEEVYNGEGNMLFPGVIDPHVHMRTPGFTHKEDFETGSKAALKGGVTRIFDMPNTQPATITKEALEEKILLAEKYSNVKMGFYFGTVASEEVLEKCVGAKLFLSETTGSMIEKEQSRIDNFFNMKTLIAVHAEEEKMQEAISYFHKGSANALYLCHVASEKELDYIKVAKSKNSKIYAEVAPHHLFFIEQDLEKNSLLYMKPMLKSSSDREALRQALSDSLFDTIGSDHAPHTLDEKMGRKSFGVPGVQYLFPLTLELVTEGVITYEQAQRLCSENAAKIFNLEKCGKIQVGYCADLTLVSKKTWKISREDVASKCGWTPYEGMKLSHCVEATWVEGKLAFERERSTK